MRFAGCSEESPAIVAQQLDPSGDVARVALLAVNRELVLLYWGIGREILTRQHQEGWGSKVIDRLAKDLRCEFPQMKGLSRTNLLYMRAFAEAWTEESIVQQVAGQITLVS